MKIFIFATFDEAEFTIEKKRATREGPESYVYDEGKIIISGIGTYSAQMACAKYASHAEEIINMGFGATLKNHALGEILHCQTIGKYSPSPQNLDEKSLYFMRQALPFISLSIEGKKLISTDFPVHTKNIRESLPEWDLLDMEGYGIAFAAKALNKKCQLIKIISDFAKEGGRAYIEKHKKELSKRLSEIA